MRLRDEQANLRVALEYAVTAGPPETALRFAADLQNHWFVRGFLSEGRHWLDRALALPAGVASPKPVRDIRAPQATVSLSVPG